MSKEPPVTDQWGRLVFAPCPFCGATGYQPNGKAFVRFKHVEGCWLAEHTNRRVSDNSTVVFIDDLTWNNRHARDTS